MNGMGDLLQHLIVTAFAVLAAGWLLRERRRRRKNPGCSDCPTPKSSASGKVVPPSEIRPFPRSDR